MGGMVDCGVAIDSNKTSPRRAAIEKAQEDLRLEYDVREVRRRELEFLEKGGNPLDFKFGNVASLSVQSTSLNVTSEAKGSFAFAPSPHGDSVESSGPNMADNLLLLDGDNSNAGTLVKVNNANNNNNAVGTKDSEEPGILRFARRNRSRSNAGTRSSALVSSKLEEKEKNKENVKEKDKQKEKDKEKEKKIDSNPLTASPIKREVTLKTVQDPVEKDDDAKDDVVKVASKAVQYPVKKDDIVKDTIKIVAEENPEVIDTDMDVSVENPEIATGTGTTGTGTGTGTAVEAINNNTEFATGTTGTGTAVEETNNNPETEIVTPSTVPKAETETASTTGTNVLTENGETGTDMELDPKPAQLEITGTVDSVKDEKGEEEKGKIEKPVEEIKIVNAVEEIKIKEMDTNVNNEVEVVTQPTEEELKVAKKEYEDSVLKQARVIEGNIKKAGETPSSKLPLERRRKSQWDFVLEEMAWLANDFMQERLWKTAVASQMCKWIANGGRGKFDESNLHRRQKNVALKLAKAVVKFWHSIDEERKQGENCMKEDNDSNSRRGPLGIRAYAIRVLEYNMSGLCEAPSTLGNRPCRTAGVLLVLQQLPEERLFYTVPAGAMQAYRDSIESQFAHLKKTGNAANHEDCETSNSIADTRMENAYEEDEVQTGYKNTYDSGFTSRFITKKRKHPDHHQKGSYEHPSNKCNSPVKLNNNSPNILRIPTKRVRTNIQTGRKLVSGPVIKMDASSDNTNSYQQEGSLQHCDSFNKRSLNLEVESPVDSFNNNKMRGLPYDELALKKKKKKKVYGDHYVNEPHPSVGPSKNPMYDHRVKAEGAFQHDQKDYLKKRMESHQFDPNNNNVAYGQQRKPKMLNASSQEGGAALMSASVSLNTVSNPKQLIKFVNSNRDRALTARKGKGIKLAGGHSGPGNPWSNFEDQALVVLVHDMGPNWELISDAINSALRFKCIYKRAKECKERHKFLMDKSVGDGADSAEDSGSSQSQPYPSTLPGIPKGFAGTLFQKLRGPVEEDTIKTHFEKIISLSQKLRPRNNQELKQITPAHNSHAAAFSQVLPNNLSGTVLTPLDLCDAPSPPQEMPAIGYGGPHGNGLPLTGPLPGPPASNMGPVMQQGSAGLLLPGTLPSPSTPLNAASSRDTQQRYGVPRGPPVQSDEHQQRMQQQQQQYNHHMVSGRGLPIPGSIPGNMRMLPGSAPGCSNGMMQGMSQPGIMRSMTQPIPRPGYPRLSNNNNNNNNAAGPGQGMLNMVSPSPPGSMISATGPGPMQPGPINPRMLRPIQNNMDEHNRHMMMHELQQQMPSQQMPAQQVNNNGGGSSAAASSPLQSFPPVQPQVGPQAPHQQVFTNHPTPHQQAYAIRFAKQMQQQQQQRMNPPAQQMTSMMTSSAGSPSPPVGVVVGPSQQQMMKNNNLPEGPVPKKQKLNAQQRQNNQSAKGGPKGRGGSILMQQTLGGSINNNMNSNNNNNNNQQPIKFSSPMATMAPLGSSVSSSGNPAAQEGVSGNEMLIGQSRPVLGPNQGFIGGAHWQNKNQVQQSSSGNNSNSNNNNRAVVQGNVFAQPSNSGPG